MKTSLSRSPKGAPRGAPFPVRGRFRHGPGPGKDIPALEARLSTLGSRTAGCRPLRASAEGRLRRPLVAHRASDASGAAVLWDLVHSVSELRIERGVEDCSLSSNGGTSAQRLLMELCRVSRAAAPGSPSRDGF